MTAPNGCRLCGIDPRSHAIQAGANGSHTWTPPTQQQIKERMLARRAERTNSVTDQPRRVDVLREGEELRMWQERAKTAELAVNRTRVALNDCKARGATGMQYELAVAVALGDREPQRGPGPLCHSTDPVTLRECALPAHDEGDHEDGDLRWPA